jgi:hypothetical protein
MPAVFLPAVFAAAAESGSSCWGMPVVTLDTSSQGW